MNNILPRTGERIASVFRRIRRRFLYENAMAGKIVELLGNKGRVSGLTFDLNNPYIATFLKCRFLFRTYEEGAEKVLRQHLIPDLPVIEFGACIGVISCLANRKLQNPDQHIVVEAQPYLIPTLEKNRDLNGCRFTIVHGALAYEQETVDFWIHPEYFIGNSTRQRSGGEKVEVPSVSLQQILDQHEFERITLIVDVEGAEAELIENELDLISQSVEMLIIELHPADWGAGPEATERLQESLHEAGFEKVARENSDYVYRNTRIDNQPVTI